MRENLADVPDLPRDQDVISSLDHPIAPAGQHIIVLKVGMLLRRILNTQRQACERRSRPKAFGDDLLSLYHYWS